jgi:hypothetical protein
MKMKNQQIQRTTMEDFPPRKNISGKKSMTTSLRISTLFFFQIKHAIIQTIAEILVFCSTTLKISRHLGVEMEIRCSGTHFSEKSKRNHVKEAKIQED